MKGRIGNKKYDTDKAVLICTLDDDIQVYHKKSRPQEVFLYNPQGNTAKEMFFDLPPEEAVKYIPENKESRLATRKGCKIQLTPYEHRRVQTLAIKHGMAMNRFVMMLVDKYESDLGES